MKAKVLLTGEIVDVEFFELRGTAMTSVYIETRTGRQFYDYELEFITKESLVNFTKELLDEDKHWQDVRERAAIAAMQGILSCGEGAFSYDGVTDEIAKSAVEQADSLVKQLRGE